MTVETLEADYLVSNEKEGKILDEGEVGFTINNKNGEVFEKEALLLSNNSKNAVSYHWDFGNGDTSTEANPKYTYDLHGLFRVKLAITDKYNITREISKNVSVICLFDGQIHGDN